MILVVDGETKVPIKDISKSETKRQLSKRRTKSQGNIELHPHDAKRIKPEPKKDDESFEDEFYYKFIQLQLNNEKEANLKTKDEKKLNISENELGESMIEKAGNYLNKDIISMINKDDSMDQSKIDSPILSVNVKRRSLFDDSKIMFSKFKTTKEAHVNVNIIDNEEENENENEVILIDRELANSSSMMSKGEKASPELSFTMISPQSAKNFIAKADICKNKISGGVSSSFKEKRPNQNVESSPILNYYCKGFSPLEALNKEPNMDSIDDFNKDFFQNFNRADDRKISNGQQSLGNSNVENKKKFQEKSKEEKVLNIFQSQINKQTNLINNNSNLNLNLINSLNPNRSNFQTDGNYKQMMQHINMQPKQFMNVHQSNSKLQSTKANMNQMFSMPNNMSDLNIKDDRVHFNSSFHSTLPHFEQISPIPISGNINQYPYMNNPLPGHHFTPNHNMSYIPPTPPPYIPQNINQTMNVKLQKQNTPDFSDYNDEELTNIASIIVKDQLGCRYLQKKISSDQTYAKKIFYHIQNEILDLICDPFGNYFIQKLIECIDASQIEFIIDLISPCFYQISTSPHGTRVVQKIIEILNNHISLFFKFNLLLCNSLIDICKDPNGNHVVQKYVQCIKFPHNQLVYDIIYVNLWNVAQDKHGCCVLQKIIEFADHNQRKCLVAALINMTCNLICHQYGNYVLQYIISLNDHEANKTIVNYFLPDLKRLCRQKHSSTVIEKCFDYTSVDIQEALIKEICINDSFIIELMLDMYGNYVIQKILTVTRGQYYMMILNVVANNINRFKNVSFGNKLIIKLVNNHRELASLINQSKPKGMNMPKGMKNKQNDLGLPSGNHNNFYPAYKLNHNFNHGSQVNFHPLYNQNYIPAYNGMINRNLIADESRMLMNINEKSGNLNQMGNHVNSKTIKSQKDSNYSRNDINQSNCDKY